MRVAIIGPLCRDTIVIDGRSHDQLGGVTYYAGMALAALGADVTLIASFGNEPSNFTEPLRGLQVVQVPSPGTLHFTNEYTSTHPDERRQSANVPPNIIVPEMVRNHNLASFDAIILGPLFHDNLPLATLQQIAQAHKPVFLAAQGLIRYLEDAHIVWQHPENVRDALPHVSSVILDTKELEFITGTSDVRKSISMLHEYGATEIIMTSGSKGSTIFRADHSTSIPAYPPERMVDPTGAGDSYLAGYVYAKLRHDDTEQAGRFAAMTATMTIEKSGPCTATADEVSKRLPTVIL